ncbi:MAG: hypothetical protein NVV63_12475 [Opitutus sp.]|nr:hypothetical protein [Opitutus sp.]
MPDTREWCFDDRNHDIVAEPFVDGIPEIIELSLQSQKIIHLAREGGFWLEFSTERFATPLRHGFALPLHELHYLFPENGGAWYHHRRFDRTGLALPDALPLLRFGARGYLLLRPHLGTGLTKMR